MPDFWLSYMLIYVLALGMGWFPAYGFVQPQVSVAGAIYSGTLPALAVAAPMAASFTRILRTSLIEELHKDLPRRYPDAKSLAEDHPEVEKELTSVERALLNRTL